MASDFSFEKLEVWQKSMDIAEELLNIADELEKNKHFRLAQQLEACAMSIPQNIAEGNGRYSPKEYIHFLHIARGSLYESITIILMCERKKWIDKSKSNVIYKRSKEIGKQINSLINYLRIKIINA